MELEQLMRENQRLKRENQQLRTRSLQDFMERAIRDDRLSQVLASQIQDYYPQPVTPWFVCVLFWGVRPQAQGTPAAAPLTAVSQHFGPALASFGQTFFLESAGTVVCLMNVPLDQRRAEGEPDPGGALSREVKKALTAVYDQWGQALDISHITFSRPATLEQGPRALYRAAVSVSEHRSADAPAVCMETGPETAAQEDLEQVYALEPLFWRQIQQRNFFDAAITLDKLLELTMLEKGSLERTVASVFSRMEVVLRSTIQENGVDLQQDPELQRLLGALCQVSSFWEMRQVAYDILATLEDRFYTPPNARNKKMARIEEYIRRNYADLSLSAASVAEEFRISPSYLSRIFKADMGVGFIEYLHRVRIEAAKELLAHGEMGMNEIAEQTGFSNRWSFTRVFKEMEGMPPGAYRAENGG